MPHRATTVDFKANARKAMADVNLQKALEKMRSGFVEKRLAATGRLPEAARLPAGCGGLILGMAGVIAAIATASQ